MAVTPLPCPEVGDVVSVNGQTGPEVLLDAEDIPTEGIAGAEDVQAALGLSLPDWSTGTHVGINGALDTWLTKVRGVGPTDVVVLGDSFGVVRGLASFPWVLDRLLRQLPEVNESESLGWRFAENASATVPQFTTFGGALNNALTGGSGGTLTAGQKATMACALGTCDGVTVVYRTAPGAGSLIVRSTVAGTVLTTINCNAAAGVHRWTSDALPALATYTFELEASGGTVNVDGVYLHRLNRVSGVRVWNAAMSGIGSSGFVANPGRGLDLITMMATEGTLGAVIIATGTNDTADPATGANEFQALVEAVQAAAPGVDIVPWIPAISSSYTVAEAEARYQRAVDLGLYPVDGTTLLPDLQSRWTDDGLHPLTAGQSLIATQIMLVMSGDPLGVLARMVHDYVTTKGLYVTTTAEIGTTLTTGGAATIGTTLSVTGGIIGILARVLGDGDGAIAAYDTSLEAFLGQHGAGVFYGGHRRRLNSQTGVGYTVLLADKYNTIIRANAGASTMTWPIDSAQAIPIGTEIAILNNGAGTITHSCPGGTISGTLTQATNVRRVATKIAANTWFVA